MTACHFTMVGIHGCTESPAFLKIILEAKILCLPSSVLQASNQVAALFAAGALGLAILPTRWIALIVFVNLFTGQMKSRRDSSATFNRRFNEWWYSIPVVPVRFLKPEEIENVNKTDQ